MRVLAVVVLCLILVLCDAHKKHGKSKNKSKNKSKESGEGDRWQPSWNRCYSCTRSYSNGACNRHYETCQHSQSACLSIVEQRTNGRFSITKSCALPHECPYGSNNEVHCKGRVCLYCCTGNLCNTKAKWSAGGGATTVAPATCPLGCKGDFGVAGRPGRPGPVGLPGTPGRDGRGGRPGIDGPNGSAGHPGLPGPKGDMGMSGLDGATGVPGVKGEPGLPGFDGIPGPKGTSGIPGQKGECDCNGGQGQIPTKGGFVAFSGTVPKVKQADDYFTICPTKIHVNEGLGFDAATGILKTLVPGVYFFSCVSIADGSGATPCELYKNKDRIFTTARDEDATGPYPLGTNQALVALNFRDIVQFKVTPKKTGFWGNISNKFKSPSDISILGYLVKPAK